MPDIDADISVRMSLLSVKTGPVIELRDIWENHFCSCKGNFKDISAVSIWILQQFLIAGYKNKIRK
jgi:hypothetical protein